MFRKLIGMWRAWRARCALRGDLINRIRSGGIPVSRDMLIVHDRRRYSLPFRHDGHEYEVRLVIAPLDIQTVRLFRDGEQVGDIFFGQGIMLAALDRMDRNEAA